MKKYSLSFCIPFLKNKISYLTSVLILLSLGALFLNISFGTTSIENNLQSLPAVTVDMNGKANISYPIEIPINTKGIQPQLSLEYNSSAEVGNMGVGWTLSGLHSITRDPAYGITFTTSDQFTSTMAGSLVSGGDGNYYSRKESFLKFVPNSSYGPPANSAPASWTVFDKSGTRYTFTSIKYQSISTGGDAVATWAVTDVRDIYGNGYSVSYQANAIVIQYADRSISINFNPTSNQVTKYGASGAIPNNMVVTSIVVSATNFNRTYSFSYGLDLNNKQRLDRIDKSETNNGSTIVSVPVQYIYSSGNQPSFTGSGEFKLSGQNLRTHSPTCKPGTICLPGSIVSGRIGDPTHQLFSQIIDINGDGKSEIGLLSGSDSAIPGNPYIDPPINTVHLEIARYNGSAWETSTVSSVLAEFRNTLRRTLTSVGFGDVDGDGKTDFVYSMGGKLAVLFSNGSSFNDPVIMTNVDISLNFGDYTNAPDTAWRGQLVDMNGDGRADYVVANGTTSMTIYLSNGNSFSNGISVNAIPYANTSEKAGQFLDLNGDGRPEYVRMDDEWRHFEVQYFSSDFTSVRTVNNVLNGANTTKKLGNRWFADINADGLLDFVTLHENGVLSIYFHDGQSFSNQVDTGSIAEYYTNGGPSLPKMFADINGDGFVDFIRYASDNTTKISYGNGSTFTNTGLVSLGGRLFWNVADLNGDGFLDIIGLNTSWACVWPGLAGCDHQINVDNTLAVIFQNPRSKENLVTQINAGFNRAISISYDSAKNIVGAVLNNGVYPSLPNLNLGQIVRTINTNIAGLSVNTDTYSYSDNRIWIGPPGMSTGLGFRTKIVTSSLSGETQLDRYIHSSYTLAGLTDYSETKNAIGQFMKVSNSSYTTSYPLGREYTFQSGSSHTEYEDGAALFTLNENRSIDSYGNIVQQTITKPNSVTISSGTYAYDTTAWILDRQTRSSQTINGVIVKDASVVYTGNTGFTVTQYPGTPAQSQMTIVYDSYGNKQSETDSLGRSTSFEYDSVIHSYQTKITNPLGFSVSKTYDTSLGLELTGVDANGAIATKRYDKYGRVLEVIPPWSSSYTERYSYTDYDSGPYFNSVSKSVVNPDGGESTSTEYFDIMGRSLRKESPGIGNNKIVETMVYDEKGQLTKKSNPYLENLETPVYTTNTYHPYEGYRTQTVHPDGSYTNFSSSGLTDSKQTFSQDGTLISDETIVSDEDSKTLSKTVNGKTITYFHNSVGRPIKITDPDGGVTQTVYDVAGRKLSQTDENSGTMTYTYDSAGNLKTQRDARGITSTYSYDSLNRMTGISYSNGDPEVILKYDESGNFTKGRLTSVTDAAGKIEFSYDIAGNKIFQKRKIDDLEVIFKKEFDIQNRLSIITYPDGTKVYNKFGTTGHFTGITMDTADGVSKGYVVGSYKGPVFENGQTKIIRETGNGVKMEIEYDPIRRRPIGLVTKLANSQVESAVTYTYDKKNNITKIDDTLVNGRTQEFVYDDQNRVVEAKGKYGVETYSYSNGGNLTKRGNFTLTYGDSNHKQAVTQATSPMTGAFNYTYDEAGNMISRNGDTHKYDAQSKLTQINTQGGDTLKYVYELSGNRIKKTIQSSGVVVYSFDGLYEISRVPGEGEKHTLYFKGMYGDIFSQMTRNDAQLITQADTSSLNDKSKMSIEYLQAWIKQSNLCSDLAIPCSTYYANSLKFYLIRVVLKAHNIISTVVYDVFVWLFLVLVLSAYFMLGNKDFILQSIKSSWVARRTIVVTPLLTVSILFMFSNCGVFGGGGTKGDAPWLLLANGINATTPSADGQTNSNGAVTGGSGGNQGVIPVTGMFFLHPDHLGSITMITDGNGNVVSGGENGGKSHFSYKPYGEILRTDSSGPDISRFKFSGQQEDKESGLLYYKSRYYDPILGRFIQSDSLTVPEELYGMNRYMYTNGNPVKFRDPSGNFAWLAMLANIIKHMVAPVMKAASATANAARLIGRNIDHGARAIARNVDHGVRTIGRNIDHGARAIGRNIDHGVRAIGRAIDHGAKDIAKGIEGSVRRIGEAWEKEFLKRRHKDHDMPKMSDGEKLLERGVQEIPVIGEIYDICKGLYQIYVSVEGIVASQDIQAVFGVWVVLGSMNVINLQEQFAALGKAFSGFLPNGGVGSTFPFGPLW